MVVTQETGAGLRRCSSRPAAPIDGYDWEESLICTPIQSMGKNEEGGIERMKVMLELGHPSILGDGCPWKGPHRYISQSSTLIRRSAQFLIDAEADLERARQIRSHAARASGRTRRRRSR